MSKAMDLLSLLPEYPKRKRNESFDVLRTTSCSQDDTKPAMAADVDRHDQKRRMIDINKADAAASTVPSPDWVMAKFRSMGATDDPLRRVMTKNVTPSDADRAHNRLLLPKKIVGESRLLEGLTEDERNLVGKEEEENKNGPKPKGLQVVMVDGEGRNYEVVLKFLTSNNAYRIIGKNYVEFVAKNNLTPVLDTVHLCLFRVKDDGGQLKLKLGLVKTTKDAEEKAMLPAAPVHEEEAALRCRAIRDGKRPLLEEVKEEQKVWRLRDIREDMRPPLEFDLNLPPSEEDSIA